MIGERLKSKLFTGTCRKNTCRVMFLLVKQIVFFQFKLAVDDKYTKQIFIPPLCYK